MMKGHMMTKAFDTWEARLDSGRFTKGQCDAWRNTVCALADGEIGGGHRTNLTIDEAELLVARFTPMLLTEEHTAQGLAWLEKYGYRELSLPRERIEAGFRHFTLADVHSVYTGQFHNVRTPVWGIHLADGSEIRYEWGAWQSAPGGSWWEVQRARASF